MSSMPRTLARIAVLGHTNTGPIVWFGRAGGIVGVAG